MTDDDHRRVNAAYYAMIELIDDQVGRMLKALEETGQRDEPSWSSCRTMVKCWAITGCITKVLTFTKPPCEYRWCSVGRSDSEAICAWMDLWNLLNLAPTLMEAAGLDVPAGMQGRSLTAHCMGRADPADHRDYVFSEYYNSWTHPRSYGSMMRTTTEKIAVYHGVDCGEVYDLSEDPEEFRNLWNEPAELVRRDRLLKACFDASVFTMDPEPPRLGAF